MARQPSTVVILKARQAFMPDLPDGFTAVEIETQPLDERTINTVRELFPNLSDKVFGLLESETVLAAIHNGPMPKREKPDLSKK